MLISPNIPKNGFNAAPCFEKENVSHKSVSRCSKRSGLSADLKLFCIISNLPFEFFTIGVSVRLSDRSLHMEEQKKIRQKLPPMGQWVLKRGPPDLQANALPTELSQHSVASLNLQGLYKIMLY